MLNAECAMRNAQTILNAECAMLKQWSMQMPNGQIVEH